MKEDITQHNTGVLENTVSCGLVMKEDITQPAEQPHSDPIGCGLVMKEDITQRGVLQSQRRLVVVW